MDWQEVIAFTIVGVTALVFLQNKFRPRKLSFQQATHCGCSPKSSAKSSIVIQGRRGEPPQIIMKMK